MDQFCNLASICAADAGEFQCTNSRSSCGHVQLTVSATVLCQLRTNSSFTPGLFVSSVMNIAQFL